MMYIIITLTLPTYPTVVCRVCGYYCSALSPVLAVQLGGGLMPSPGVHSPCRLAVSSPHSLCIVSCRRQCPCQYSANYVSAAAALPLPLYCEPLCHPSIRSTINKLGLLSGVVRCCGCCRLQHGAHCCPQAPLPASWPSLSPAARISRH